MSEVVITGLTSDIQKHQLREIFFESSARKEFKDEAEREAFFQKYAGIYISLYSDLIFVANQGKVLGYCLGTSNSLDAVILDLQPHVRIFEDLFAEYPGHFHINCRVDARGCGVGAQLLEHFEKHLRTLQIPGVHLITSPDARNRSFYIRQGYCFEARRAFEGKELLFLGKKI